MVADQYRIRSVVPDRYRNRDDAVFGQRQQIVQRQLEGIVGTAGPDLESVGIDPHRADLSSPRRLVSRPHVTQGSGNLVCSISQVRTAPRCVRLTEFVVGRLSADEPNAYREAGRIIQTQLISDACQLRVALDSHTMMKCFDAGLDDHVDFGRRRRGPDWDAVKPNHFPEGSAQHPIEKRDARAAELYGESPAHECPLVLERAELGAVIHTGLDRQRRLSRQVLQRRIELDDRGARRTTCHQYKTHRNYRVANECWR